MLVAAYAAGIGATYLLGLLVEGAAGDDGGAWFDSSVIGWAARERIPWLVDLMRVITEMGGTIFVGSALVLAAVLVARRAPGSSSTLFPLITLVGALTLSRVVKSMIERPRPPDPATTSFIAGSAFPSGHATAAAAMFTALAVLAARELSPRARRRVYVASGSLALVVASSRVYLGVHWPTDVIAGLGLGAFWTLVCARATSTLPKGSTAADP